MFRIIGNDRSAAPLHGSQPPLPLGLGAHLSAQNIKYSMAVKPGRVKTLSLELTPATVKKHLFQDRENPLAVTFNQALKNRQAQAAELTIPERAELAITEYLLKSFAGMTPSAKCEVEDFLTDTVGFPDKITLDLRWEKDKPAAVTCPEFQWLVDLLVEEESSKTDFPIVIKEPENALLYWRPDGEHSTFNFVLLQRIPAFNQVVKVSADLRSGDGPTFQAAFYDIDRNGHSLVLRSGRIERAGIAALKNTSFSDFVAEVCGSNDPDMIEATRAAVVGGSKMIQPSMRVIGLGPSENVTSAIVKEEAWTCTLAEKLVAALRELDDPLYAGYLRHLTPVRTTGN